MRYISLGPKFYTKIILHGSPESPGAVQVRLHFLNPDKLFTLGLSLKALEARLSLIIDSRGVCLRP